MTREEQVVFLSAFCHPTSCSKCPVGRAIGSDYCCETNFSDMANDELNSAMAAAGHASDMVNKPTHYQLPGGMECWDVMVAMFGAEEVKIWAKINAFTYLFRHKKKNGEEDIRKALVNLEKYFELGADK